MSLDLAIKNRLVALGLAIINQKEAKVVIEPYERSSGFWLTSSAS